MTENERTRKALVLLAGGAGERIWPYAEVRPKVMIPVLNRPIIGRLVNAGHEAGFDRIYILAGPKAEQIRALFLDDERVEVTEAVTAGSAEGVRRLAPKLSDFDAVAVLSGDTFFAGSGLQRLGDCVDSGLSACALVDPVGSRGARDWICCEVKDRTIVRLLGHPRRFATHRLLGFALTKSCFRYLETGAGFFDDVLVGTMPPEELFVEMALAAAISDGVEVVACEAGDTVVDVDKPWHILEANTLAAERACSTLSQNELNDGASIDATARVDGFVRLGTGSTIGKNVVINGNVIVGAGSTIDNGAIVNGPSVIGNGVSIANYCRIAGGSVLGNECRVDHCAEFSGVAFDRSFFNHYMDFVGVTGTSCDIGAATVCGTLRFDDGPATFRVQGRREQPEAFGNVVFIGDYCRTGVNAAIMPGVRVGSRSIVGAGVVLAKDLNSRTMVRVEQHQVETSWGPERYGW